jgi:hypothetical protein
VLDIWRLLIFSSFSLCFRELLLKTYGGYEGVISFVEALIKELSMDLERLYKMGIRNVAVTSLEPVGCLPYVTIEYSYKYCNETANNVASHHNLLLQEAVDRINKNLSCVNMVVLDQYTAFTEIISHPQQYGHSLILLFPPFVLCNNLEKVLMFGKPCLCRKIHRATSETMLHG